MQGLGSSCVGAQVVGFQCSASVCNTLHCSRRWQASIVGDCKFCLAHISAVVSRKPRRSNGSKQMANDEPKKSQHFTAQKISLVAEFSDELHIRMLFGLGA